MTESPGRGTFSRNNTWVMRLTLLLNCFRSSRELIEVSLSTLARTAASVIQNIALVNILVRRTFQVSGELLVHVVSLSKWWVDRQVKMSASSPEHLNCCRIISARRDECYSHIDLSYLSRKPESQPSADNTCASCTQQVSESATWVFDEAGGASLGRWGDALNQDDLLAALAWTWKRSPECTPPWGWDGCPGRRQ